MGSRMGMPEQIESEDDEQEHVGSTRQNQSSEPETEFPEKDDEKEHVGSIGQNQSSEPETEFPEKACSNCSPQSQGSTSSICPACCYQGCRYQECQESNAKKEMPRKECQERNATKEMPIKECTAE